MALDRGFIKHGLLNLAVKKALLLIADAMDAITSFTEAITATAAEINMAADSSANTEIVTTTNIITAAESGKTFILNSATAFVSTLPAPAVGLRYKFIIGQTVPSGGNHTVVTASSANIIDGSAEVAGAVVLASDEDSINFIDTCSPGDWVEVFSDGTNWYVKGAASVTAKLTFTAT